MSMRGRQTASCVATCRYAVSSAAMVSAIVSTLATSSLLRMRVIATPSNPFRQLALVILVEEFGEHAALNAVLGDHRFPILLHLRIFHPIRNGGAAFGN